MKKKPTLYCIAHRRKDGLVIVEEFKTKKELLKAAARLDKKNVLAIWIENP